MDSWRNFDSRNKNPDHFFSRSNILIEKKSEKKSDQKFFPSKNRNSMGKIFIDVFDFWMGNFFGPKKIQIFFRSKFSISKKYFLFWIFVSRVKISTGIQKSYLERRAMSATMLKIQFLKGRRKTAQKPCIFWPVHHLSLYLGKYEMSPTSALWKKCEKWKNFKTKIFGTYIQLEVPKNEFIWQSDHGLCHQTTVYRSRKFAKNEENLDILQWVPSYVDLLDAYFWMIK